MSEKNISIDEFHIPRWNELPNVDLYLDQIVTLINKTLSPFIFFNNNSEKEDSQLLTKTMINNYVKNNLITPPEKKLYSKKQVAKLFVICVLKQVYSMHEIDTLIKIALQDASIADTYDDFCNLFEDALRCAFGEKDFIDKSCNNDKIHLIKTTLLSCSYKIYVQNTITANQNEELQ